MRRIRLLSTWATVGAILGSGACASGGGPQPLAAAYTFRPGVEVENRNYQRMRVTLEVGGARYYLGEVEPFGIARFEVPAEATGAAARIAVQVPGDVIAHDTRYVRFANVEALRLTIGSDVRQSVLIAR